MTRTKKQANATRELESRLERAHQRLRLAQDHDDLARVAQLDHLIGELTTAIREQEGTP